MDGVETVGDVTEREDDESRLGRELDGLRRETGS